MPESANPFIAVIGLSVGVCANSSINGEISSAAHQTLADAEIVIGSERQLQIIEPVMAAISSSAKQITLPKLAELKTLLDNSRGKNIVVLASGDPLYYGIGRWLVNNFSTECLRFYPAVSSIQAACHQLGLSLQDVDVVSLHGRPLEKIRTRLHANKTLVILTDKYSQPQVLAKECLAAGFEQSSLTVCERLGYSDQQVREFSADYLAKDAATEFDPLHVTVINVAGAGGLLPEFPGIADTLYVTGEEPGKGMISKREVRLVILSLLQPAAHETIWDIGAGCGGVTVELAYWQPSVQICAVEYHQQRLHYLQENCERFGVSSQVNIIPERAPEVLPSLPNPHKIFIGGSDGQLDQWLPDVWEYLPSGGVLVASAVVDSTKDVLRDFANSNPCTFVESVELAVSRGSLQPAGLAYQKKLPVEVFKFQKK